MDEFKVEVTDMIEHEDGRATLIFDTCEKGRKALISYGLLTILETAASIAMPEELKEKVFTEEEDMELTETNQSDLFKEEYKNED